MNNENLIRLNRESTKITISEFYERFQLNKYNFDPPYQRRGDVWTEEKQSFLIDSILKNYPMPPIFLHQEIDSKTGATIYNIIDGKQRLTSILKFINNEISLPADYDVGAFGDSRINGKKFEELDDELQEFKMQFWRYVLSVEYIETNDTDIINNVFDRLNRNGEPLEPQELRKAKYYDTNFLKMVDYLATVTNWDKFDKIKFNRMQDSEFVSELVFLLLENGATDASKKENLDRYYDKWTKEFPVDIEEKTRKNFIDSIEFIEKLDLDYEKYKINGVSHFYAIFAIAIECVKKGIDCNYISKKLNKFYTILRNPDEDNDCSIEYKESMQSNTRSKAQRDKRIMSLIRFCEI